jgi:hypothetical protein
MYVGIYKYVYLGRIDRILRLVSHLPWHDVLYQGTFVVLFIHMYNCCIYIHFNEPGVKLNLNDFEVNF